MASYLIKRNPFFTSSGTITRTANERKGYSETLITAIKGRKPASSGLKKGDTIYVAEKGGVIFAKGTVLEDPGEPVVFHSLADVIRFSVDRKDAPYWMDKLQRFEMKQRSNPETRLEFQEYFIKQTLLDVVVLPDESLKRMFARGFAHSIARLFPEEVAFLEGPHELPQETALRPEIPSWLRLQLHSIFNKKYSVGHWIDIDHFVPKSAHGPGNIKENLVPIGLSLNRYKGDAIPSAFFKCADRHPSLKRHVRPPYLDASDEFLRPRAFPGCVADAQAINDAIKLLPIEEARAFYRKVLLTHNPNYREVLDSL